MPHLLSRLVLLTVGSLLAVGCVPNRPNLPGGDLGQAEMAILTSSDDGNGWDIQLLDTEGNLALLIDADLPGAVSLSRLSDGSFLVSDGADILRVDADGSSERFNQEPMPSVVYRMNITEEDEVTVAEEYDVTKLDDEGNLLEHTVAADNEFCWMDAAPGTLNSAGDALLDIFGPTLATWDEQGDSFDMVAVNFAPEASILGRDHSGTYYAGSELGGDIWKVSEGGASRLVSLPQQGIDAWGVHAIEPASADSVFVLYSDDNGSGVVRVDASGNAQQVLAADRQAWLDMVTF